jgi:chaperone modulatory protein CbpM
MIDMTEGQVVENEVHMTIVELSHASRTPEDLIMTWVSEGVLSPAGSSPEDWRLPED